VERVLSSQPSFLRRLPHSRKPLGKSLYRGLLKTVARVWKPSQVQDLAVRRRLLGHMQAAKLEEVAAESRELSDKQA
jgi:hypothetical protein